MSYRIVAYITAYSDKTALERCIASLKCQTYSIEKILIVDNSPHVLLSPEELDESIIVKSYPQNIGISGGLRVGIEWSIKNEFDFIWTFDQDTEPSPDALKRLIETYDNLKEAHQKIGIIAPLPVDRVTGQQWNGMILDKYQLKQFLINDQIPEIYKCDAVITAGSLISIQAAHNTPFPNENLFIEAVDWEYCLKLKKQNYSIFVNRNIVLKQRFGETQEVNLFYPKIKIMRLNCSPLRYYYRCRNNTFVERSLAMENKLLIMFSIYRIKIMINLVIKILLLENLSRRLKIWACLRGTYDGFRGNLGKTWV
jgi:rhamnosyltransferase